MVYAKDALKGRYKILHPNKYIGDPSNIIYRSSYELKFMKWCDSNTSILEWGSEELAIPYISPLDNRVHRYFVDFYIKVQEKGGDIKKYLVEIKPLKFTKEPAIPARKTKRFLQEVMQWGVNQAKWKYATEFCEDRGWKFLILTEKELGITNK
jgi:hypothetical protein